MSDKIREQLLNNNELLIQTVAQSLENNRTTLQQLQSQTVLKEGLIDHLKGLYDELEKIPIKTKTEENNHELLRKILIDFWDYK